LAPAWHITGPERGNIWWICGEDIQPTAPNWDFLQWFEDWLDGVMDWWTGSKRWIVTGHGIRSSNLVLDSMLRIWFYEF